MTSAADPAVQSVIDLEAAVDAELPKDGPLRAKSPGLVAAERRWSAALWDMARRRGPQRLDEAQVRRGRALTQRPVFICGTMRSGTTLLSNLLDSHPQVLSYPAETDFLSGRRPYLRRLKPERCMEWYCRVNAERLASGLMQPGAWALGRSSRERQPYVDYMCALMAWIEALQPEYGDSDASAMLAWYAALPLAYKASSSDERDTETLRCWIEKTPGHEYYLDELWQAFPRAKVLQMVRDPNAALASRCRVEQLARPTYPTSAVLHDMLSKLARSYAIAGELSHSDRSDRYRVVRYEDLVADRMGTMNEIAHFLGIVVDDRLYWQTLVGRDRAPNTSFRGEPRPRTDENSERTRLTAAYVAGPAAAFGYLLPELGTGERFRRRGKLWLSAFSVRLAARLERL